MKTIKVKEYSEIPDNFTGIVEYEDGYKEWWNEDKIHRIDGPAIEYSDVGKGWYIEGEEFYATKLSSLIKNSIFLEKKQNGKYNLDWLFFNRQRI
jgi:hypothetical protein